MLLLASARTSPADPLTFRKQETWPGKAQPSAMEGPEPAGLGSSRILTVRLSPRHRPAVSPLPRFAATQAFRGAKACVRSRNGLPGREQAGVEKVRPAGLDREYAPRTSTISLTRNPANPRLPGWCARQQREVMQKRRNRTEPLVLVIDSRRSSSPPENQSVPIESRGYSFFGIFSGSSRTRHIRCQESRHDRAVWPATDSARHQARGSGCPRPGCQSLMPPCGTRNDEIGVGLW